MKKLNKTLLNENIEKIAKYDFDNKKVFGSAYFVFQNNNLEFQKCYGKLSPTSETSVDENTLFRLASMTKPISAIATLILCERGLLSLDDTIEKYLPEFENIRVIDNKGNNYISPKIPTIKNLLTHTAGIGGEIYKHSLMTDDDAKTLDSTINFFIEKGLDFEPGTAQLYSGTGAFDVLTKIIEKVTKTDYLSFLKKEIFIPCDMPNTTFLLDEKQKERLIKMHFRENDENVVFKMPEGCNFENFPSNHFLGGAGLISSLRDYCNFAKLLHQKGEFNGKRIVTEETFNQLCTPQVPKEIMQYFEIWGLGVRVITEDKSHLPTGVFGWSGAYGSHFWIDPENEIFAVFMKNSKTDGGAGNESALLFEKAVYASFE